MVHVSKNKITDKVKEKMYGQLTNLFLANTTQKDFSQTLFELLSPTERIMLAKRVGIIGLLTYEYSTYKISHIFKVSVSTILKIQKDIEQHRLDHIVAIFKRKKSRKKFLDTIDPIAALLFPQKEVRRVLKKKMRRNLESWREGGA